MNISASGIFRAVAGYGLQERIPGVPPSTLGDEAWEAALAGVVRHRITGHFMRAIHDGAFPATDAQHDAAVEAHERALGLALLLERVLLSTVGQLADVRASTRVLRGPAVAHTDYPDPGLRSFGDIDLLVANEDYDTAVALLCAGGGRRRYPEPRHGFDRRFGKGVCLELPSGLEIDLHRTFVAGPFGLAIDTDSLFGSEARFSLGGQELCGLDREGRFLDSCFHAALGAKRPRLVPLRDVAQMTLSPELDVARLRDLCRQWRCGIVVQRAVGLAWDAFRLNVTSDVVQWAREHECSTFERQALHSYVGENRSYARQAVAGIQALRGLRDKVAYAAKLAVPRRAYARSRDGSYLRRARRAFRLFLHERAERREPVAPMGNRALP
jgi:Uncharacterised nucleotidyltransferase